mgnify:CR=1 FL=1
MVSRTTSVHGVFVKRSNHNTNKQVRAKLHLLSHICLYSWNVIRYPSPYPPSVSTFYKLPYRAAPHGNKFYQNIFLANIEYIFLSRQIQSLKNVLSFTTYVDVCLKNGRKFGFAKHEILASTWILTSTILNQ